MHYSELNNAIGNIDIYLLDQILKGRFDGKSRLLDAGCGEGRNLKYFIQNGYDTYGIDINPIAIKMIQMMYKSHPRENFLQGSIEELPWKDSFFDAVICNATLHFAAGRGSFYNMIGELVRVLNKKGLLFIRMATTIGLADTPESTFTYLLSPEDISYLKMETGLTQVEPFKTVLVEDKRSMATLVLEKY